MFRILFLGFMGVGSADLDRPDCIMLGVAMTTQGPTPSRSLGRPSCLTCLNLKGLALCKQIEEVIIHVDNIIIHWNSVDCTLTGRSDTCHAVGANEILNRGALGVEVMANRNAWDIKLDQVNLYCTDCHQLKYWGSNLAWQGLYVDLGLSKRFAGENFAGQIHGVQPSDTYQLAAMIRTVVFECAAVVKLMPTRIRMGFRA